MEKKNNVFVYSHIHDILPLQNLHAFVGLETLATNLADKQMANLQLNLVLVRPWLRLASLVTDITVTWVNLACPRIPLSVWPVLEACRTSKSEICILKI